MKENFYLTTPIYYVNDKPHIGHAYTTILGDVLSRYNRLLGNPTYFQTGADEHGQKVEQAAKLKNMTPQEQCDTTVVNFKDLWEKLEITHDNFIRTTDVDHKKVVCEILQELFDKELIYKKDYSGNYCVPCERFYTEKDLVEGKCPECNRETSEIVESNYFFKMSNYQEWLIDYIQTHPDFIQPAFRANETLGFLKQPLNDLCISRPKERLSWGIELPFDKDYVCYVWFDALINYISGAGYRKNDEEFKKWWPASYQLIGKDILTTHTVYWTTMLKAMEVEMPKTIFAHGWWLFGKDKMSKSLGNVVDPMEMCDKYGIDAFKYFLLAEMILGNDASFTEEAFIAKYNSDLANDLGNLLNRVVKMTIKQFDGIIPEPSEDTELEDEFNKALNIAIDTMEQAVPNMKLNKGIDAVLNAVRAGNKYIEKTAPWALAKNGETARLQTVLYTAANALRIVSALLYPIMPNKMCELRKTLGIKNPEDINIEKIKSNKLISGQQMLDIVSLFPRIQVEKKQEQPKQSKKKQQKKKDEKVPGVLISIDDFFKTKLKTAKVLEAEKVEGADKLLKLQIEVGEEKRQLIAGIAEFYTVEEIIGKIVIVVANLKPAKIRGIESQGMLLAAKKGKKLQIVTLDGDFPTGASVG